MNNRLRQQAGVTLIEMMVVVTIIALFAALVLPKMMHQADRAKITSAHAQINAFSTALGSYKLDTGVFPTTEQGLQALRDKPESVENWQGPYLQKEIENDPGGTPTSITSPVITETSPTSSATAPMERPAETGSMPTSSVGEISTVPGAPLTHARGSEAPIRNRDRQGATGVTLIEMMVVVALIALMAGISYPAITSGIDSMRLKAATNSVVSFLDSGLSRAERRQQVVEITISKQDNSIEMQSSEPGFYRKMPMPEGVSIVQVLPPLPENPDAPRSFFLYPGGTVPPLGVQLINRRNVQRVVRVDPITGVPQIETPEQ